MRNKLNDLTPTEWIKFQKSWFIHNPPRREQAVKLHPAKFPESLAREFIEFFTKRGQTVLDPMAGTGSALLAALQAGRNAIGVELLEKYAAIAHQRCRQALGRAKRPTVWARVICADARLLGHLLAPAQGRIDYVITSPPYWDMLRRKGFETQRGRRQAGLDVHYSEDERDLGNEPDYERFLEQLAGIYRQVAALLRPQAYLTVVVKNVKKGGHVYPLAWDLARRIGEFLTLKDERIWCQDDVKLAPYGMGSAWVSNTCHHYCLMFRKES